MKSLKQFDYSEKQIRDTYKQLWEIEQTFRITKSDLEFRPVYHFKKENIKTHFLICYCAVLVLRLLQFLLKQKGVALSAERIVNALNSMNCENLKGIVKLFKPITAEALQDLKALNQTQEITLNRLLYKLEHFRSILSNIKFHTTSA